MEVYNRVTSGVVAGSATAVQLPDIPCRMVVLVAETDNSGNVYVGGGGVTIPGGTGNATGGIPLAAGDQLGPLPLSNLNLLYIICDNAGDDLTYLAIG